MGSSAIALIAEYGEVCPGAISFVGSSCSTPSPASREPSASSAARSPISPMPQLRVEGIEKSGSRCRRSGRHRGARGHRSVGPSMVSNMRDAPARNSSGRTEADDEVTRRDRSRRSTRDDQHAPSRARVQPPLLVGHDAGTLHHGRPAAFSRQDPAGGVVLRQLRSSVVQQDTIRDLLPHARAPCSSSRDAAT